MKYLLGICVTILLSNSGYGDVYDALQLVYDNNPVINQGRSASDVAYADVQTADTQLMPYVGLHGNLGAARTKIGDYTFDYTPMQYGIEMQQNIFQGGAMFARMQSARNSYNASLANLSAIQQDVFLSAINAYISVLNTREVLKLNQNNQRVLREYYDFVSAQQQVGRLTKTDVYQAAARLEMAKYATTDAQANYDNAQEMFARICGVAYNDFVDIELNSVEHLFPQSIDDAEQDALRNHPVLIALGEKEQATAHGLLGAYQSILPSVDLRGAIQQIEDVPYLDEVRDSRIGVYLKVPLFDKGNALASSDKVRAQIAGIQDEIVNARRTILEQLRSAWNIYQSKEYAIRATGASVQANQVALDGIRDEERRGRRTVLDVLNAEQELLNSRVANVQAKHARVAAYFAVLAAAGKLTPDNLGLLKY